MSLTIVLRVGGLRANFAADFSSVPLAAGLENRDTEIPHPPSSPARCRHLLPSELMLVWNTRSQGSYRPSPCFWELRVLACAILTQQGLCMTNWLGLNSPAHGRAAESGAPRGGWKLHLTDSQGSSLSKPKRGNTTEAPPAAWNKT